MSSAANPSKVVVLQHPSADRAQKLAQLRSLARTMDSVFVIPGTNFRVGLDGLIGIIPGIGDFAGLVISCYFLLLAAQLQIPKVVLARMGVNIVIDTLVGAVPFFGDLFDFVWTANRKNMELIERHLNNPRHVESRSGFYMVGVGLAVVLSMVVLFFVVKWLAAIIYALVNGWFASAT
jgi:hypothetical protein